MTISEVSFVVIKKKPPLLEITFVDTGFVLLFAILAVAEEMEHFLFLILGKIFSRD